MILFSTVESDAGRNLKLSVFFSPKFSNFGCSQVGNCAEIGVHRNDHFCIAGRGEHATIDCKLKSCAVSEISLQMLFSYLSVPEMGSCSVASIFLTNGR